MSTERLPDSPSDDQLQSQKASGDAALPAPPPATPRVKVPRLTSLAAVRREMSRQYAQQLRGEISTQTLTRRIYALSAIREAFRDDEIERRLAALEAIHGTNSTRR